jgi:hypothetical protein
LGLHLRSFVTTTKPQPSLIHNLKSVPKALTGDISRPLSPGHGSAANWSEPFWTAQQPWGHSIEKATFLQQSAVKCACTSLPEAIEKLRTRWLSLFLGEE